MAFASTLVQALNLILLTAPELSSLRKELKEARYTEAGAALFVTLYKSPPARPPRRGRLRQGPGPGGVAGWRRRRRRSRRRPGARAARRRTGAA